jgi:uncharacterized protein
MERAIQDYKFISQLKKLPYIEEVWLFGSRARGDNQNRSDIDLAIICPKANDKDWLKGTEVIDNADTLLKIDYVRFDKKYISDSFYNNILREKRVL